MARALRVREAQHAKQSTTHRLFKMYRRPVTLSPPLCELIDGMLALEPRERTTVPDIARHPWLAPFMTQLGGEVAGHGGASGAGAKGGVVIGGGGVGGGSGGADSGGGPSSASGDGTASGSGNDGDGVRSGGGGGGDAGGDRSGSGDGGGGGGSGEGGGGVPFGADFVQGLGQALKSGGEALKSGGEALKAMFDWSHGHALPMGLLSDGNADAPAVRTASLVSDCDDEDMHFRSCDVDEAEAEAGGDLVPLPLPLQRQPCVRPTMQA